MSTTENAKMLESDLYSVANSIRRRGTELISLLDSGVTNLSEEAIFQAEELIRTSQYLLEAVKASGTFTDFKQTDRIEDSIVTLGLTSRLLKRITEDS